MTEMKILLSLFVGVLAILSLSFAIESEPEVIDSFCLCSEYIFIDKDTFTIEQKFDIFSALNKGKFLVSVIPCDVPSFYRKIILDCGVEIFFSYKTLESTLEIDLRTCATSGNRNYISSSVKKSDTEIHYLYINEDFPEDTESFSDLVVNHRYADVGYFVVLCQKPFDFDIPVGPEGIYFEDASRRFHVSGMPPHQSLLAVHVDPLTRFEPFYWVEKDPPPPLNPGKPGHGIFSAEYIQVGGVAIIFLLFLAVLVIGSTFSQRKKVKAFKKDRRTKKLPSLPTSTKKK